VMAFPMWRRSRALIRISPRTSFSQSRRAQAGRASILLYCPISLVLYCFDILTLNQHADHKVFESCGAGGHEESSTDARAQIDPNGRRSLPTDQCAHQDSEKGLLEMADIASETALQDLKSLYPYGKITSSSDGNSYRTLSS